jgi:hypothetical protein
MNREENRRRFHIYSILFVEYKFLWGGKEYSLDGVRGNGRF